jgi:phosphoglycerate dehydrogenase-like enzyme
MPRRTRPQRPRLLVLAPRVLFESFFDAPRRARLGRSYAWRRIGGRRITPQLREALPEAEALVTTWDSPRFDETLLDLAPRLGIIAHCGGEVKARFARPLFDRLRITNAPGPMAPYVAELAVTFLLLAARRVDEYRHALRGGGRAVYRAAHDRGGGEETLRGRTVGILGFGRIGRQVARLLRPFGPRLLVHDPYVRPAPGAGVAAVAWPRLVREAEFLVLAAGLTKETAGLLDRAALARLRTGATVVNVARGGLVDLPALTAEVRRGRLRCALDVTDPDEPLPPRHPLRKMRGAALTPHVGAAALAVRRAMADVVLDELERFFRGKRPGNRVTAAMLDRMT